MDSERPAAVPWWPALLLALVWAVLPALPALSQGELLGQPYTDLYPSVWGMWWFADEQPGFPLFTTALAAPGGMPFYYSSPIHGWLAWPLIPLLGVPWTWNLLVLLARFATVLSAVWAARRWGMGLGGSLVAGAVYGASPFFHGYAVEGIVEGLDGWTLALWLGALRSEKKWAAVPAFALVMLSSWYLGAVACVMAVLLGRRAWPSLVLGLVLVAPALVAFLGAFPAMAPLDPSVRAAMGASLSLAAPGVGDGLNPFAMTTWVGVLAPAAALTSARRWPWAALALAVFGLLSFGVGPWYEFPPFSVIRFPYRFHAGTLAALAWLAGQAADGWRRGWLLAPLVVLEGLLLSPIEPIIPGAPAEMPSIYRDLPEGDVLLDIPGPVAKAPGEMNPSRPRARYFLYGQVFHGRKSPWAPDFNAVGVQTLDGLESVRRLDPVEERDPPVILAIPTTVDIVVLRPKELRGKAELAHRLLLRDGFSRLRAEPEGWVYAR